MGTKKFRTLHDWVRHGYNIHLNCEHCPHTGVVEPHAACLYFRLHRWSLVIEAGALQHFYCTKCGAKAGSAQPTEKAPTVVSFFPADDRGWQMMQRRLRG